MAERRRGLGRGLGALIPPADTPAGAAGAAAPRPVDVFFADRGEADAGPAVAAAGAPEVIDVRGAEAPPEPRDEAPRPAPRRGGSRREPPEGLLPIPGLEYLEVPVGRVAPNPRQPRRVFDDDALAELVQSVQEVGVLQPVVVRPAVSADGEPQYELVMGERRWRAVEAAGLATVPAIVRQTRDDDLLRDALLENLHRADLNPLEEAAAYQQLLDDFGCTHDQLAQRIGRSRPQISNTIRLLRLPPLVQRRVAAGVLSAGHAKALLGLPDGAAMERLAQRVVAEGLSVRATEEAVALGGDAAAPAVRSRAAAVASPGFDDLVGRLSDRLETRVSVAMGRRKGRLVVEFAGVDDLNRILGALAPGDPGVPEG